MSKATLSSSISQAPLVRRLTELGLASPQRSRRLFANQLADLIDISDAIELSRFFTNLNDVSVSAQPVTTQPADVLFEQHRAEMIAVIDSSFITDTEEAIAGVKAVFRLPALKADAVSTSQATATYRRFYSLHQSELERRVARLRTALLDQLEATNEALAQVAAVDTALGPMLAKYSRRCFATLPKLVAMRFEQYQLQHGQREPIAAGANPNLQQNNWLLQFHGELQRLLHAELALRLQPLEGMLRCLDSDDLRENL